MGVQTSLFCVKSIRHLSRDCRIIYYSAAPISTSSMNIEMDKSENQELIELIELVSRLKKENEQLIIRVNELEEKLNIQQNSLLNNNTNSKLKESVLQKTITFDKALLTETPIYKDLTLAEYMLYGRQLILPDLGKSGIPIYLVVYLFIY